MFRQPRQPRKPRLTLLSVVSAGLLLAGGLSAQLPIQVVEGTTANESFGNAIAALGDVNADGTPDILVGAYIKNNSRGAAYLLSGKTGATLRTWNGVEEFEYLGQAVANVGDVDKDGVDDVALGAPFADSNGANAGRVMICSGQTGELIRTHIGTQAVTNLGNGLADLGDYDNDGWPDYALGAHSIKINGVNNIGRVTLHSGKTGATLVTLDGDPQAAWFGYSLANAGDVNGDGRADLAIASPDWVSPVSGFESGRVEVRSGANLHVTLFAVEGGNIDERMGFELAGAGDVNGDGLGDIIAGSYFTNTYAGVARVFLGPSGAASWVFNGEFAYDFFASSVGGAGDVDKDGHADLIVGAPRNAVQIADQPGYAKVHSGRTGQVLCTLQGAQVDDSFGFAVAGVGDVNGDGWTDVAAGSVVHDGPNGSNAGRLSILEVLVRAPNLGFGGPGSAQLSMYGSKLDDFGQMDLVLSGAKPNAPTLLVASPGTSFLAFKGGVIVPNMGTGVLIPLTTNGSGKITIPGILGGFGPVSIAIQYLIKDAAQPLGFAMSNAISAPFLP
jgi:hypothetical protein